MAEKVVSPGVFTNEIDQSFLPAAIGDIGGAVIGPTVKGPALVPTVITSYSEFQQIFGDSFKSGSNYYQYLTSHTAENYLKHSGKLTVVRILDGTFSEATASVAITGSVTAATFASGSLTIAGTFGQTPEDELQITVGGTEYRFIAADPANGIPVDSSPIFYHNTGSSAADYLDQVVSEINTAAIGVTAVDDATAIVLSASSAGTSGNSISVDSGSGATFSDVLTLEGGTDSTTTGNSFKLHTLADGAIMNNNGTALTGSNNTLLSGSKHNLRWEVASVNEKKGTFTLLVRQGNDTIKRKQVLETWNNLSLDPNSNNYIGKRIGDSKWTIRGTTSDPYLQLSGSYPNKSKYVWAEVIEPTVDYLDENGNVRDPSASGSLPKAGSGSVHGAFGDGDNGYAGFDAVGNTQGTKTGAYNFYENIDGTDTQGFDPDDSTTADGGVSYTKALNLLSNQDEYDINMIMLPGILRDVHTTIVTKAIDVAENRGDTFVVIDPVVYGSSITDATTQSEAVDTNYGAMYWPWVQVPDNQTGKNRWVPPSVVIPGIYAFNDKVAHPWFAPAGLNRGGIDTAIQAERKLTHSNRDDLYESSMNPIATFPGQGVTVWGQKTLQKKASALDRINVRRLLIKVKKFIASSSRFLVFEQNNAATRRRFLNIANPFLEQVQSNSGLTAFRVVMDDTNNTPDVVDRNILYGQIFLQPTITAEFIVLDFTVQPSGATFPE
jgi:hypothetical protein